MSDLSRRAVACKHWKWLPGMLTTHEARIFQYCGVEGEEDVYAFAYSTIIVGVINEGELPDLTDPATMGCLLALVREAWGDPMLTPRWIETDKGEDKCCIVRQRHDEFEFRYQIAHGPTEAEALITALEAAP